MCFYLINVIIYLYVVILGFFYKNNLSFCFEILFIVFYSVCVCVDENNFMFMCIMYVFECM